LGAATLIHAGARAADEAPPYDDIVKKYDRNGDGRLDEEEKVAAKESMAMQARQKGPGGALRERVAKADPEQRAKMLENLRARIEESPGQMRRFDKNGNGKLDDAEWAEARAQFEQREKAAAKNRAASPATPKAGAKVPPKAAAVRDKMLNEHDRDGDGRLDESERAAMAAANREKAEQNPRILRRFDKNRDGKLDDAEWAAARQQVGDLLEVRKQK
jgi:Ca2+-binding EF-hand superfamily protein